MTSGQNEAPPPPFLSDWYGRRKESGCRLAKHPPYDSPPHTLRSLLSGKCRVARGVQTKLPFHGKPLEAHCEAVGPFEQRRRRSGREKSPSPTTTPPTPRLFAPIVGFLKGGKRSAESKVSKVSDSRLGPFAPLLRLAVE